MTEQCCQICGDIGVAASLVACCRCKGSVQHLYCMRNNLTVHNADWLCEHCEPTSQPAPTASSSCNGVSKIVPGETKSKRVSFAPEIETSDKAPEKRGCNWEKKVSTGKAKYISVKEAIKLSSGGAEKSLPSGKLSSRWRTTQPTVKENRTWDQQVRSYKEQSVRLSSQQNLWSPPSKMPKPLNLGSPVERRNHSVSDKGGRACTPMEPITRITQNIDGRSSSNSWFPALDDLWKGSFNIDDKLIRGRGRLNLQLRAHPPSQVHRKAYEFSKQMPTILRFEVTPCEKLSTFEEYSPGGRDISLYFFSSNLDSSEDYDYLIESIAMRNSALRMLIGNVELLIFSSKLLPSDLHGWRGKHFLWGVFRCLEKGKHPTGHNPSH